MTHWYKGGSIA